MTNEENKCLNKAIFDYQREMFDKGGFYQSEMAQYLMQLSFERCAQWKDRQNIADLGGWQTEEPSIDCFCIVETDDFPKNCRYVVAEWDNDAKCFYSESGDSPISHTRYKIIEPNDFLINR